MNYLSELQDRSIDVKISQLGDRGRIICPFHNDTDPSLDINLNNGMFHCYGCKESGIFTELIAELDGISIDDAQLKIVEDQNIEADLLNITKMLFKEDDDSFSFYKLSSFHKNFPPVTQINKAKQYLLGRKINEESFEKFDLRFGGNYGLKRNRIIIPVYDLNGKLATYAARSIVKSKLKTWKPRAVRFLLYGLFELLIKSKYKGRKLIIVEGEFDVMYLQQLSLPAVATMGTAGLSDLQLSLILKHCDSVYLCYDGDKAGYRATVGYVDRKGRKHEGDLARLRRLMPACALALPEGKDPNDLTEEEVNKYIRKKL